LDKNLAVHAAPRSTEANHCSKEIPRTSMDMLAPWVRTLTTTLTRSSSPAGTSEVDLRVVGSCSLDRKKTQVEEAFASCSELPVTVQQRSLNTLDVPMRGASSHPTSDVAFTDFEDIERLAPEVDKGRSPSPPSSELQTQKQPSFTKSFLADPQQQACFDDNRQQGEVFCQYEPHTQNVEIAVVTADDNQNLRRSPPLVHPEDLQRNMHQPNAPMQKQRS